MDSKSYKTQYLNKESIQKSWFVADADGKTLGRFSSEIAKILRGKNKASFTPHIDCGDYVIVINSDGIKLTGKKWRNKMFITTLNRNRRNTLDDLFNEWDNIFSVRLSPEFKLGSGYKPYKIDSDEDGVTLTINVPGYNDKLIDVSVSGDRLTIEGKAHSGDTNGFKERFTLSDKFDGDGVEATIVDGILTVAVPYKETVKPRKVKVKVG